MKVPSIFLRLWHSRMREQLCYLIGCGMNLGIKWVLLCIFLRFCGLEVEWAYFFAHLILLFFSFFYHYKVTFLRKFEGRCALLKDFCSYTASVIVLKGIDWVLVVNGIKRLEPYLVSDGSPDWLKWLLHGFIVIGSSGILFVIRYFFYRFIFRKPDYVYYTGEHLRKVWIGHAVPPEISGNAASGGIVTALCSSMLKRHEIDAVLAPVLEFPPDDPPQARYRILRTPAELRQAQGSIYFSFPLKLAEMEAELESVHGKIAVVGLPCQLRSIQTFCSRKPGLKNKVFCRIGLFCGHDSQRELFFRVMAKKDIKISDIASFRFNKGKWRGKTEVKLKDGTSRSWSTGYYKLYQNLFILSEPKCLSCIDHFAEEADISTGDIWLQAYRFQKVKPSITAARTECGEQIYAVAMQDGMISAKDAKRETLFSANSRAVIFHKAAAARQKVFAHVGIRVHVPEGAAKPRWNELLAAKIILKFYRMDPDKVMRMNRRVLKFWLYVQKALTSF